MRCVLEINDADVPRMARALARVDRGEDEEHEHGIETDEEFVRRAIVAILVDADYRAERKRIGSENAQASPNIVQLRLQEAPAPP